MISFLYALRPSRSTITGICVTVDLGDTVVFCDAYFEQRFGILREGAGEGVGKEVAGEGCDIESDFYRGKRA